MAPQNFVRHYLFQTFQLLLVTFLQLFLVVRIVFSFHSNSFVYVLPIRRSLLFIFGLYSLRARLLKSFPIGMRHSILGLHKFLEAFTKFSIFGLLLPIENWCLNKVCRHGLAKGVFRFFCFILVWPSLASC